MTETELTNDELISVLRALHFHIQVLANTDENVRNEGDLSASKVARSKLANELKRYAFID